jgi:TonB family protein
MAQNLLRTLFGDDVFISYRRADGSAYATTLKEQLVSMDISCFIDYEKIYPGDQLTRTLERAITRSTAFVLIGTPDACNSDHIKLEIAEALRSKRRIILIDINQSLATPEWDFIGRDNLRWISQTSDSLKNGRPNEAMPSPHVYEDFGRLFVRNRRNIRIRAAITIAALILLFTSFIAVWQASVAEARASEVSESNQKLERTIQELESKKKALEETNNKLTKNRIDLEKKNEELRSNQDKLTRKTEELRSNQDQLTRKTEEAIREKQIADNQRKEAETQTQIAVTRQWAAQANMMRDQAPDLLIDSVVKAVKSNLLAPQPSFDLDQALRNGIALLPRPITLISHKESVEEITFSQDWKFLATLSSDKTAHVWDLAGHQEIKTVKGVSQIVFSPNGKYLVTKPKDELVIWLSNVKSDQAPLVLSAILKPSQNVMTFSPDGEYFAATANDKTVRLWRAMDGQEIARFPHQGLIKTMAFSPQGKYIVTGSDDKSACIWEVPSGRAVKCLPHDGHISLGSFSPDERHLATVDDGQIVWLWEISSNQKPKRLAHEDDVIAMTFSPRGNYLAIACDDNSDWIWNVTNGEQVSRFNHGSKAREGRISLSIFSPDEKQLATTSNDNTVRVWETNNGREIARLNLDRIAADSVIFSPNGKYMATATRGKTAQIWETAGYKEVARVIHEDSITGTVFSQDGTHLATASYDKTVRIWKLNGIDENSIKNVVIRSTSYSNGRLWATEATDRTIHVREAVSGQEWEMANSRENNQENRSLFYRNRLIFSPNGKHLFGVSVGKTDAQGKLDHAIQIWETLGGSELKRIENVNAYSYSIGRKYLITADKGTVQIWETNSGLEVRRLNLNYSAEAIVISPDGSYVVVTGDDKLEFWDMKTGRAVTHHLNGSLARLITFSQNGKYVICRGGQDIRKFDVTSGLEIADVDGVEAIALSENSKYLAFTTINDLYVWDLNNDRIGVQRERKGSLGGSLETSGNPFFFTEDEKYLVTLARDDNNYVVKLWVPDRNKAVGELSHDASITAVEYSPSGEYLSTASSDGIVQIFDIRKRRIPIPLPHEKKVNEIAFSLDGKYLATASDDNTARVWEASSGQEIIRLPFRSKITSVYFSQDGKYLNTSSISQGTQKWLWKPSDLIQEACSRLAVNLTEEEYHRACPQSSYETNTIQRLTEKAISSVPFALLPPIEEEGIPWGGQNGVGIPQLTYEVKAEYTETAWRSRTQGTVILSAVFTSDGRLTKIKVIHGLPNGLTEKAIEATQKLRFKPATKKGKPIDVRMKLEIPFNLL